jgi:hypothetical protein
MYSRAAAVIARFHANGRSPLRGTIRRGGAPRQRGDSLLSARKARTTLAQIARCVAVTFAQKLRDPLAEVVECFRVAELLLRCGEDACVRELFLDPERVGTRAALLVVFADSIQSTGWVDVSAPNRSYVPWSCRECSRRVRMGGAGDDY